MDTEWSSAVTASAADTANLDAGTVVQAGNVLAGDSDRDSGDILTVANVQGSGDATAISVTAAGVVAHGTYGGLTILANASHSHVANAAFDPLTLSQNPTAPFTFTFPPTPPRHAP